MGSETEAQNSPASPPGLLQLPQANAAQQLYVPGLVPQLFQEALSDPEEFRRKSDEHAKKMGVDPEAWMRSVGLRDMRVVLESTPRVRDTAELARTASTPNHEHQAHTDEVDVQMQDVVGHSEPEPRTQSHDDKTRRSQKRRKILNYETQEYVETVATMEPLSPGVVPVDCEESPNVAAVPTQRLLEQAEADRSSREDVQMEDTTGSDRDISTPGNDPSSDDGMSLVGRNPPDLRPNAMQLRKQNDDAPTIKPKSQKTKKRDPTIKTTTERKSKKDKAKRELTNIPRHAAAGGAKSRKVPKVAAESSKTGTAREEAARSMGPMEQTPPLFVEQIEKYPIMNLPKWYAEISIANLNMKQLAKKRSPSVTSLESLKNCIGRCEVQMKSKPSNPKKLNESFNELRDHVHKAEFLEDMSKYVLRSARILHEENGLPRIFGELTGFPWDLKADAYQLYLRWMRQDFKHDVLRGIITVKGPNRGSDRLCPKFKKDHPPNAKRYGDDGLVLGQCWPSQLCTVRDGAHGSSQGGIFGEKDKGTYSIVLSGGGYNDRDDGDTIVYSGTEGKNFTPTEVTQYMIMSCTLGNVIRVIRSHHLSTKNEHRPEIGLRYDGLYTAKSYQLVDKEKQTHLFTLERCPGQEKIRSGNGPESRPTKSEVAEYRKLKEKI